MDFTARRDIAEHALGMAVLGFIITLWVVLDLARFLGWPAISWRARDDGQVRVIRPIRVTMEPVGQTFADVGPGSLDRVSQTRHGDGRTYGGGRALEC